MWFEKGLSSPKNSSLLTLMKATEYSIFVSPIHPPAHKFIMMQLIIVLSILVISLIRTHTVSGFIYCKKSKTSPFPAIQGPAVFFLKHIIEPRLVIQIYVSPFMFGFPPFS